MAYHESAAAASTQMHMRTSVRARSHPPESCASSTTTRKCSRRTCAPARPKNTVITRISTLASEAPSIDTPKRLRDITSGTTAMTSPMTSSPLNVPNARFTFWMPERILFTIDSCRALAGIALAVTVEAGDVGELRLVLAYALDVVVVERLGVDLRTAADKLRPAFVHDRPGDLLHLRNFCVIHVDIFDVRFFQQLDVAIDFRFVAREVFRDHVLGDVVNDRTLFGRQSLVRLQVHRPDHGGVVAHTPAIRGVLGHIERARRRSLCEWCGAHAFHATALHEFQRFNPGNAHRRYACGLERLGHAQNRTDAHPLEVAERTHRLVGPQAVLARSQRPQRFLVVLPELLGERGVLMHQIGKCLRDGVRRSEERR